MATNETEGGGGWGDGRYLCKLKMKWRKKSANRNLNGDAFNCGWVNDLQNEIAVIFFICCYLIQFEVVAYQFNAELGNHWIASVFATPDCVIIKTVRATKKLLFSNKLIHVNSIVNI